MEKLLHLENLRNNGGWCNPPRQHFDMSQPAFQKIAVSKAGIEPVLYRKGSCKRTGGIRLTITRRDYFDLVLINNVGATGDIAKVWMKGSKTNSWEPMSRNWGSNCQSSTYLNRQSLSFRIQTSNGRTKTAYNVAASNWVFGRSYSSNVQF
ncbi:hypothetical protein AQUCO_07400004v1 [Aquilegia coerulea]|uniref:Expansin n=1 Tax=Aquilegia coerulea TaxID=218851 RepID=A0A2G5C9E3_AQUCA|nr:hypothetical protein AQUCO_07400004v1 [Aquilegia coerulea]